MADETQLYVFNSLTRKKEKFEPLAPPFVGIYVCGPTVYGDSHLGHAKSYIGFDVIVRYLRFLGYRVRYVQNITDVGHLTEDTEEDKIIKASRLEQVEPMEVVEKYARSYFEDMDALNVVRPDISPRASAHIPEQIDLIQKLIEKGAAYEANGNVYFSIRAFPGYGKLSGRRVEEQKAGARVEVDSEKRDPADFLLWRKAAPDHILKWNSPWGPGYPGWHLECSVMASRYLGETIDIHGGGLENQFPHHESEIAQSETATGKLFARYWLHNNMVTRDGQKMGKSLGNQITLKEAFRTHSPALIRYFLLRSHYRSPVDYSAEAIRSAASGLERLRTAYDVVRQRATETVATATETVATATETVAAKKASPAELESAVRAAVAGFSAAMNDDFNTSGALAAAFDFVSAVNKTANSGAPNGAEAWSAALKFFDDCLTGVLGIDLADAGQEESGLETRLIAAVIRKREEARAKKDFALGDLLREILLQAGIEIKDGAEGTAWKRKST